MKTTNHANLPLIGWREWVRLPDLGIQRIKVKVDTGARSSSLHAFDIEHFDNHGEPYVRFKVHTAQRKRAKVVETEAKVIDLRPVRSSSGKANIRPVILTNIELLGHKWAIEVTLANRKRMGFRMLLGREAFRSSFLVDAGKSYYGGKLNRNKKNR